MTDSPIEFYFDFNSPYGYVGAHLIDNIAERYDRKTDWYPISLGVAFKITGMKPMSDIPLKGEYFEIDSARVCRYYGVDYLKPDVAPFSATAASRAFYWIKDKDPGQAKGFAMAIYAAALAKNEDVSAPSSVVKIAAGVGIDQKELLDALQEPDIKQRLVDETDGAIKKGVFGSPFVIADGEPFFGVDRFEILDEWLVTEGF
ncbi:MAG: 2-hydroxychromene-2-carboxylate isomerase [Alphaproteobacteria bacterium]|nr:2-hydroxychromene-2-carboxylate isomerase [Alphaproteobacteria bacterium]